MKSKDLFVPVIALACMMHASISQAQDSSANSKTAQAGYGIYNFQGEMHVNTIEDGKRISFRMIDNKVSELSVDGKMIADTDYQKYDGLIKRILVQAEIDRKQAEIDRKQADKDRQQADKDRQQAERDRASADKDRQQADKDRMNADKDRERAELDRASADKDRKEAELVRAEAEKARKQADIDRAGADRDRKQAELDRAQAVRDREHADADRAGADRDRKQADLDRAQAGWDREQADKDRKQAEIDRARAEKDRQLLDELLHELVTLKVVTDADSIRALVLNKDELIVNDKKQSPEVHERLKNKYLNAGKGSINFRQTESFRNFSIQ